MEVKLENLRQNAKKVKLETEFFYDINTVTVFCYITFTLKNNKKVEYLYDRNDGTLSKKNEFGGYGVLPDEPRGEVMDLIREKLYDLIDKLESKLSKVKNTWEGKLW
jgi:hypothetical protein